MPIEFFDRNQSVHLIPPCVINHFIPLASSYDCIVPLPDTYLATLYNTTVFAGTDMVLMKGQCLYDEIAPKNVMLHDNKCRNIIKTFPHSVIVKMPVLRRSLTQGVLLTKDHAINYFHWLVECLPKLMLLGSLDPSIPLLVDENLPAQSFEALDCINEQKRPIIRLSLSTAYNVRTLYYPSRLSIIYDNSRHSVSSQDVVYSPKAITFVRSQIMAAYGINPRPGHRKLYVSRKGEQRRLLNNEEIETLCLQHGFEIVFPEKLSFREQVILFSQASMIVGQSGAGMANILFSPLECRVLIMMNNSPHTNLHIFNGLGDALGMTIHFLIGKSLHDNPYIHADFTVNIDDVTAYISDGYH